MTVTRPKLSGGNRARHHTNKSAVAGHSTDLRAVAALWPSMINAAAFGEHPAQLSAKPLGFGAARRNRSASWKQAVYGAGLADTSVPETIMN